MYSKEIAIKIAIINTVKRFNWSHFILKFFWF